MKIVCWFCLQPHEVEGDRVMDGDGNVTVDGEWVEACAHCGHLVSLTGGVHTGIVDLLSVVSTS